jgi:hypothetical protein
MGALCSKPDAEKTPQPVPTTIAPADGATVAAAQAVGPAGAKALVPGSVSNLAGEKTARSVVHDTPLATQGGSGWRLYSVSADTAPTIAHAAPTAGGATGANVASVAVQADFESDIDEEPEEGGESASAPIQSEAVAAIPRHVASIAVQADFPSDDEVSEEEGDAAGKPAQLQREAAPGPRVSTVAVQADLKIDNGIPDDAAIASRPEHSAAKPPSGLDAGPVPEDVSQTPKEVSDITGSQAPKTSSATGNLAMSPTQALPGTVLSPAGSSTAGPVAATGGRPQASKSVESETRAMPSNQNSDLAAPAAAFEVAAKLAAEGASRRGVRAAFNNYLKQKRATPATSATSPELTRDNSSQQTPITGDALAKPNVNNVSSQTAMPQPSYTKGNAPPARPSQPPQQKPVLKTAVRTYSLAFKKLPGELNEAILSQLSSLHSLRSAALSCRSLHHAAKSAKDRIATTIVFRMIDPALLRDALAAAAAFELGPSEDSEVEERLFESLQRFHCGDKKCDPPKTIPFASAVYLSKIEPAVAHFSDKFQAIARDALEAEDRAVGRLRLSIYADKEPSWTEQRRFARAFYRFETYCQIVGHYWRSAGRNVNAVARRSDYFFDLFGLFELEQILCVVQFMGYGVVAPGESAGPLSTSFSDSLLTRAILGLRFTCKRFFKWAKLFEGQVANFPSSRLQRFQFELVSRGLLFLHNLGSYPDSQFRKLVPLAEAAACRNDNAAGANRFFIDVLAQWVRYGGGRNADALPAPGAAADFDKMVWRACASPGAETDEPGRAFLNLATRYVQGTQPPLFRHFMLIGGRSPLAWHRMAYVLWDMERIASSLRNAGGGGGQQDFIIRTSNLPTPPRALEPWAVVGPLPDPEERRIFGEGFYDEYEGSIYD